VVTQFFTSRARVDSRRGAVRDHPDGEIRETLTRSLRSPPSPFGRGAGVSGERRRGGGKEEEGKRRAGILALPLSLRERAASAASG